jgi:hypothetical protein
VSTVAESFVPSETADGFDHRGNKTEAYVPAREDGPQYVEHISGITPEGQALADRHRAELVAEGVIHEPAVSPSERPVPAPADVHPVASESDGYRAPGGLLRDEIRSRIRKVRPYSKVDVDIPEWDITVEVRSMSLGDRNDIAALMATDGGESDTKKFYPGVIIACTYDANGDKVFTDDDIAWVTSLDAHILDKIAIPAMKLNGFVEEKVDEAAGKSDGTETSA